MLKLILSTAVINIKDAVYCKQVIGFVHSTKDDLVLLLNKSSYRTLQADRCWEQHFGRIVSKFCIQPTDYNNVVYVLKNSVGPLIIHLHLQDSLVFSKNTTLLQWFLESLNIHYKIKWTEKPTLYLCIKLHLTRDSSYIVIWPIHQINTSTFWYGQMQNNEIHCSS